jgi:hypothetical protein
MKMTIRQAIAKVQDEIQHVKKDADNPYFKSRYATYENVVDTIHDSMRKNGIVHFHGFSTSEQGSINVVTSISSLTTDEQLVSTITIPTKANDPQAAGSAITYAKRYSLLAMLGLGTEDDDGNAASNPMKASMEKGVYNPKSDDVTKRVVCPIHKVPMKHFERDGRDWWSHETNEGWCNGRITNYNKSQNV